MSDYRDIVKEAIEKGILLDECGLAERYYDAGSYRDFCGMDPQEILENMRKAGQGGGGGDEPSKFTITYQLSGYANKTKEYPAGAVIENYTAQDYNLTGVTIDWKDASGQTYNVMPARDFTYIGEIVSAQEKIYLGQIKTSDFDASGKTLDSSSLISVLHINDPDVTQGTDIEFNVATGITYQYIPTQEDLDADEAFYDSELEPEDAEAFQTYVLNNSEYFIIALPDSYLNQGTLDIVDDFGGEAKFITTSGYSIDGINYTIVKFLSPDHEIADYDGIIYPVPNTYFGVDLSREGYMTRQNIKIIK